MSAVWNALVAVSFVTVFASGRARAALGLDPHADTLVLWLLAACVAVFGLGYWWVSRDLSRNHDIVRMGTIGKLLVVVITTAHAALGSLPWLVASSALGDLVLAGLFLAFLRSRRVR